MRYEFHNETLTTTRTNIRKRRAKEQKHRKPDTYLIISALDT